MRTRGRLRGNVAGPPSPTTRVLPRVAVVTPRGRVDLEGLIGGGLTLLGGVAKRAPLAADVLPLLADAERAVVRVLRKHLTDLDPPPAVTSDEDEPAASPNQLL